MHGYTNVKLDCNKLAEDRVRAEDPPEFKIIVFMYMQKGTILQKKSPNSILRLEICGINSRNNG